MRTFLDVINSLNPAHPEPMMEPRTISGQIQEVLGAKPSTEDDPIKALLSQRFQPNFEDSSNSLNSAALSAIDPRLYGSPQAFADKRMDDYMTRMTSLARAQSLASGGSGSVFAQTMQAINDDPELTQLSMMDKIRLAQNKLGTNLTMDANGQTSAMTGAPQALGALKYGENQGGETATQEVKQAFEPTTAGLVETSKNNADIAAAGPLATVKQTGEAQGIAQRNLPTAEKNVNYSKNLLREIVTHKGASSSFGLHAYLPIIKGSDRADFNSKRNQINGIAFLQAFSDLKGSGAISDKEGESATTAITRMGDPNISEQEFKAAATELYNILETGFENQKLIAAGKFQGSAPIGNQNIPETLPVDKTNPGFNLPGANTPLKTPSGINYRVLQ